MGNKTGATRLGFGLLLKFFEQEGRFPRHVGELPKAAVDYMAGQVKVDPALLAEYDWSGRSIERHRAQVREALGFRESTRADEDVLAEWLADKICPMVFTDEGLRSALPARCRTLKIEPPGRMDRIVGAGRARFEREFCLHVLNGLSADSARPLWELATGEDGFLLELKSDPGRLGLETLLEEIVKLRRAKALGLSADLFGGCSDRLVASWRARAMASHPSDFAANQPPVRLTLVAAPAWSRTTEITDALVDLFIGLVSKINTRAERKVERAIEAEAMKVHRKTEKLFSIAEASLRAPEGTAGSRSGRPGCPLRSDAWQRVDPERVGATPPSEQLGDATVGEEQRRLVTQGRAGHRHADHVVGTDGSRHGDLHPVPEPDPCGGGQPRVHDHLAACLRRPPLTELERRQPGT